jgi:hypothetical protein
MQRVINTARVLILSTLLFCALSPAISYSIVHNLRVPQDYGTIQAALNAASGGDVITLAAGNYTGFGNGYGIRWNRDRITLVGAGAGQTIISADALGRCITVEGGVTSMTLESLTIMNARVTTENGAAIYIPGSTWLDLDNVIFSNNDAYTTPFRGGGIYGINATVTANHSRFTRNRAYECAACESLTFEATNCIFDNNQAADIGLVGLAGATFEATNCVFYANTAWAYQVTRWINATNCIFISKDFTKPLFGESVVLKNCDINTYEATWNTTNCIYDDPSFISTDETSADFLKLNPYSHCIDTGTSEGASDDYFSTRTSPTVRPQPTNGNKDIGIFEYYGTALMDNPRLSKPYFTVFAALHEAITGDAVTMSPGTWSEINITWPPMDNVTFRGAGYDQSILDAQSNGGVFSVTYPLKLTIEAVTIRNGATPFGAGINLGTGSTLEVNRVKFSRNIAYGPAYTGGGGAIYAPNATVIANNCLFYWNTSMHNASIYGNVNRINNCTFYENDSYQGLSTIAGNDSKVVNSILWDHITVFGGAHDISGSGTVEYSDVYGGISGQTETYCITLEPQFTSTDESSADFLRLMMTSPCINTGTTDSTIVNDIASIPRPQGAKYDMGCFERGAVTSLKIYINGVYLRSGDIISQNTNRSDVLVIYEAAVSTIELSVDGVKTLALIPTATPNTWSGVFSLPQGTGDDYHTILFNIREESGANDYASYQARVMSGSVQVIGMPLNYPNPFKPLSTDPSENTTVINYTLSVDAPITVIVYDITGHEVLRRTAPAGTNGGRAGVNTISWNGRTLFGDVGANGMYVYKIISGNRVISSGKIVVLD